MSLYRYKAVAQSGEVVEGSIDAVDRDGAVARLADMGYIPIRAHPAARSSLASLLSADLLAGRANRASSRDIMIATRELATLLEAGLELERALTIIVDLSDRAAIRGLFANVLNDVRGGAALSEAMGNCGDCFAPSYVSLVRAGEAGGTLDVVIRRLADYLEQAHATRESLRSALIYPTLLLVMAVIAVIVMVAVVLPQFETLFASSGQKLPLLTRVMLGASDAVARYGWIALLAAAAAIALLRQRLRDPVARVAWHSRFLALPLVGVLLLKADVARFARTLGTLLRNGVATIPALAIVRQTVANAAFARDLGAAADRVQSGATISDALAGLRRFPALASNLILVGEESGRLEDMLDRTAQIYEGETQRAVQRLLALLLPTLTALIGIFIAAVIAAVFLAILSVNQLAF